MDGSGNEESGTAATDPIPVKPLAPCPFCGGTNVESCYSSWEFYRVDCESCGASGPRADVTQVEEFDRDAAEALACESWNRRVPAQESHDHPPGLVHRDYHAAVVAQMQVDRVGVIARPGDGRWRECQHHHHGCACREHAWEVRVAGLEAAVGQLNAHTWEQERAAVVKWLGSAKDSHPVIIKLLSYVLDCIEKGEHWPEGEKT